MRVILGGTFDPVHIGHLRMATELADKLEVQHVYLMPCFQSVHKKHTEHEEGQRASSFHRLNMLRIALTGDTCLRLDDREIRRAQPSYSIDSLLELRAEIGSEPLCLVMGADSAQGFQHWKRVSEFSALTHIVLMQRPGWGDGANSSVFEHQGFDSIENPHDLNQQPAGKILNVSLSALDVSSSGIRVSIADRRSIRYLVTDAVHTYICDNGLYLKNSERNNQG